MPIPLSEIRNRDQAEEKPPIELTETVLRLNNFTIYSESNPYGTPLEDKRATIDCEILRLDFNEIRDAIHVGGNVIRITVERERKPHISELSIPHALDAARMCGIQYERAEWTKYGVRCVANEYDLDFVFVVKPEYSKVVRFGLAGRATDNIHLICRFLEKHYRFKK